MIKIPTCFFCDHCDLKAYSCPAYKQGIPEEVLFSKRRDEADCGNGVGFTIRKKDN